MDRSGRPGLQAELIRAAVPDGEATPARLEREIARLHRKLGADGGRRRGGNISAPPQFAKPADGNYRLQTSSPSRNAADPSLEDRDGSRADMGAYGGPDAM